MIRIFPQWIVQSELTETKCWRQVKFVDWHYRLHGLANTQNHITLQVVQPFVPSLPVPAIPLVMVTVVNLAGDICCTVSACEQSACLSEQICFLFPCQSWNSLVDIIRLEGNYLKHGKKCALWSYLWSNHQVNVDNVFPFILALPVHLYCEIFHLSHSMFSAELKLWERGDTFHNCAAFIRL